MASNNLLDTIRKSSAVQQPGITDETQKLQTLLRARSGKAVEGPEVTPSNLAEQASVAQAQQQVQQQVLPQAQIQAAGQQQQLSGQVQQQNIQAQEIAQSRKFDTIQNRLKTDQLLNELSRDKGRIDTARYQAGLEQAATQLRLQTKEYTDNLIREGNRARLDDENQFRQELANQTFGNSRVLLEKQLGNKSILDANDREFNKAMAQLDIDTAYEIFKDKMQSDRERALYSGIGAIATAAPGVYSVATEEKKK